MEEWRPVISCNQIFAERYEVSSEGRIRANPSVSIQGSKPGKILYIATDNKGYKQVYLYGHGKRPKTIKLHRIVAESFLGIRPFGMTINHINGEKSDNRVANLEWLSNLDNARHAVVNIRKSSIEIYGQKLALSEAIEKFGGLNVSEKCARRRITRLKWSAIDAITIPQQPTGRPSRETIQKRAQQSQTRC